MQRFFIAAVMAGAGVLLSAGGAGAQDVTCPGSPQVLCPAPPQIPQPPEVGGAEQQPPSNGAAVESNGAAVEANDQVAQPAPTRRAQAQGAGNGLPVTGSDVTTLLAAGTALVVGGAGLVLRSRYTSSHAG